MKKIVFMMLSLAIYLSVSLFAGGQKDIGANIRSQASKPELTTVEILYLNHSPVRKVLVDLDKLLANYGEDIQILKFDFDTSEGQALAKSRSLGGHIPLAVFVNGSTNFEIDGRSVEFISFPQGQGTGIVPDGMWSIDDLKQVLDRTVKKN